MVEKEMGSCWSAFIAAFDCVKRRTTYTPAKSNCRALTPLHPNSTLVYLRRSARIKQLQKPIPKIGSPKPLETRHTVPHNQYHISVNPFTKSGPVYRIFDNWKRTGDLQRWWKQGKIDTPYGDDGLVIATQVPSPFINRGYDRWCDAVFADWMTDEDVHATVREGGSRHEPVAPFASFGRWLHALGYTGWDGSCGRVHGEWSP